MLDFTRKPLSETLNTVIELMTERIDYSVSDEAPNSYAELKSLLDGGEQLVVYSGGSETTIFADPKINFAFRAWHDLTHYQYEYDFSLIGEMFTCNAQIYEVTYTLGADIAQHCRPYLTAEIIGQRLYYDKYKCYVEDQQAFVLAYMANSKEALLHRW